jgi:hypothetical protein
MYGSDKSSAHGYEHPYSRFLPTKVGSLLEIGLASEECAGRGSIFSWADIYPEANIYGGDISPKKIVNQGRIRSFLVDQSDKNSLREMCSRIRGSIDVVIDDGSHSFRDSSLTFDILFEKVSQRGIYCIEKISAEPNGWQQTQLEWSSMLSSRSDIMHWFVDSKPATAVSVICFVVKRLE